MTRSRFVIGVVICASGSASTPESAAACSERMYAPATSLARTLSRSSSLTPQVFRMGHQIPPPPELWGRRPHLGTDVWAHAYYLTHNQHAPHRPQGLVGRRQLGRDHRALCGGNADLRTSLEGGGWCSGTPFAPLFERPPSVAYAPNHAQVEDTGSENRTSLQNSTFLK